MAPIISQDSIDMFPIIMSTLVASASLVTLVVICACCRQKEEEEGNKPAGETEPVEAGLKAAEGAPIEEPKGKEAEVPAAAPEPEEKPKSVITSKKDLRAPAKVVAKQQSKKPAQPKALTPKSVSQASSQIQPPPSYASLVETQTGGITGSIVTPSNSAFPVPQSQSGEPSYPASEAVEFENPAYDTIGPEMEDPFKGYSGPKPPPVVAELVQPVQRRTSSRDQGRMSGKAPTTTAAGRAASKASLTSSRKLHASKSTYASRPTRTTAKTGSTTAFGSTARTTAPTKTERTAKTIK